MPNLACATVSLFSTARLSERSLRRRGNLTPPTLSPLRRSNLSTWRRSGIRPLLKQPLLLPERLFSIIARFHGQNPDIIRAHYFGPPEIVVRPLKILRKVHIPFGLFFDRFKVLQIWFDF